MAYTDTEAKRKAIQQALIAKGYDCGPDGVDGVLGGDTATAIISFRADHGFSPEAIVDGDFIRLLDPFPETPKGPTAMQNWLTGFVGTTAFKYLVAMVATFIATKLGLDKGSIEGLLTQLIGVAMGAWGMWESSRQKIVINGEKVAVSDLTQTDKATVTAIVNKTASK